MVTPQASQQDTGFDPQRGSVRHRVETSSGAYSAPSTMCIEESFIEGKAVDVCS